MFMFKMLRKKLIGQKKGFTLVELMIVIAIIGVLALVLIPQAGKMRDNAKLAGVDANMRMVQAHVEAVIDEASSATELQTLLVARIGESISNPFNSATKTVTTATSVANLTSISTSSAVAVVTTATTPSGIFSAGANSNLAGTVVVAVTGSGKDLKAEIFVFDNSGKARTTAGKQKTVTK